MISAAIYTGDTEKRMKLLAQKVGITMRQVAYDEMRLALNNAIKFTQPSGGRKGQSASASKGKKEGYARIEADIRKVFVNLDNREVNNVFRLPGGELGVKMSGGGFYRVPADKNMGKHSASKYDRERNDQRNRRTGRVFKLPTKAANEQRDGALYVNRPHAKDSQIKAHIRHARRKVGQMKAGWIPALQHFAQASHGRMVVPAWVGNEPQQKMGASGGVIGKERGAIFAVNTTPYFGAKRELEIETLVHSIAQKSINRKLGMQRRLDALERQFNGKAVA